MCFVHCKAMLFHNIWYLGFKQKSIQGHCQSELWLPHQWTLSRQREGDRGVTSNKMFCKHPQPAPLHLLPCRFWRRSSFRDLIHMGRTSCRFPSFQQKHWRIFGYRSLPSTSVWMRRMDVGVEKTHLVLILKLITGSKFLSTMGHQMDSATIC